MPSLDGSPETTAIIAPLASTGGAGAHLSSADDLRIVAESWATATTAPHVNARMRRHPRTSFIDSSLVVGPKMWLVTGRICPVQRLAASRKGRPFRAVPSFAKRCCRFYGATWSWMETPDVGVCE